MQWKISENPVSYQEAVNFMEERVKQIIAGEAEDLIWLTEHPPIYTAGVSAKDSDLLVNNQIPVYKTNRGGKYTYHGPGMRIIYVMTDLKKYFAPQNPDISKFVQLLENWIIAVLARLNIKGEIKKGRVGIWVTDENGHEKKIAAIGIKLKKWVSYHGIAININPDLSAFNGIIPCGISEFGVTSLSNLKKEISLAEIDFIIKEEFSNIFTNLLNIK